MLGCSFGYLVMFEGLPDDQAVGAGPADPATLMGILHGCTLHRQVSYLSVACRVISGTLASAFDNGQSRFAAAAISWNFVSSMPGTVACSVSAIRSITKPSPCLDRRTLALVSTSVVASPALSQANENAMVKHAAWAAPRISSGLVPRRSSSKRLAKP